MFEKLIKEPLIQFFMSGFVLYALYLTLEGGNNAQISLAQKKSIILPTHIVKTYTKEFGFDENTSEKLLAYNNVLLEESYFLELYKQDKTIKSILLNKMELLLNQEKIKEPTEEDLQTFYTKHSELYGTLGKISFSLLDVSHLSTKTAIQLSQKLNLLDINVQDMKLFINQNEQNLKKNYGNYFYHQVARLFPNKWSKPILAKGASYLVYIVKKQIKEKALFVNIEREVYQDYMFEKKLQTNQKAFQKIAQHYEIKVR
jgi:hypothetical protein